MQPDPDSQSDVYSDISKPVHASRVDVLTGPERRRRWPDSTKIAIVAETLEPGAVVSVVARHHGLYPSQLFDWVKRFRAEAMALRTGGRPCQPVFFAPIVSDQTAGSKQGADLVPRQEMSAIEIRLGAAIVSIRGLIDTQSLAAVLKALKDLT